MSSQTKRLAVLRSRTDHDLLILVERELDRGLALADVAMTRTSPFALQAEKAVATAVLLLARVPIVSDQDRERIDDKIRDLRTRLEQVPASVAARFASSRAC